MDGVIEISGLENRFGAHQVHKGVDLIVRRGEIMGLVGGSGAGKSVLLRSVIGLQKPSAGHIRLLDHDIEAADPAAVEAVRSRIGVLFQDGALFSSLTVAENIQVPLRENLSLPEGLLDRIAAMKIAMVGLAPEAGAKLPAQLSGGMRKRAGLARALAMDPEILFLDEPTAGLDPIGAAAFDQLILDLRASLGLTVFMVTHDLDSLAAICDRIAVLVDGKVRVSTLADHMKDDHPWIQAYFHGPRARAVSASGAGHMTGAR